MSPEHQVVKGSDFQRLPSRALKIKESQMKCEESMQLHLRRCNLSTGQIPDETAKLVIKQQAINEAETQICLGSAAMPII